MTAQAIVSQKVLRKHHSYPHPPDVVWAALTSGDALAQWLMPNDFEPVVGHRFEFRVDPAPFYSGRVQCEVLELEPPRRMVWSWITVPAPGKRQLPPMQIEWLLTPEAGGTLLELRQTGLEGQPRLFNWMMAMGWGTMLKRWLPKVLAAFERTHDGLVYRRLEKPPNRGHHRTKTVPANFHK
jgi:uncharacterized protein YndB with AHSA1/START domain